LADLIATQYVAIAAAETTSSSDEIRSASSRRWMLAGRSMASFIAAVPQVPEAAHGPDVRSGGFDLGRKRDTWTSMAFAESGSSNANRLSAIWSLLSTRPGRVRNSSSNAHSRASVDRPVADAHALGRGVDDHAGDRPAVAGGIVRRSSARTRASNSLTENGLVR